MIVHAPRYDRETGSAGVQGFPEYALDRGLVPDRIEGDRKTTKGPAASEQKRILIVLFPPSGYQPEKNGQQIDPLAGIRHSSMNTAGGLQDQRIQDLRDSSTEKKQKNQNRKKNREPLSAGLFGLHTAEARPIVFWQITERDDSGYRGRYYRCVHRYPGYRPPTSLESISNVLNETHGADGNQNKRLSGN